MGSEYICRRCGSKQEAVTCGDCETTVCVVCYDRCRRCDKPLCSKHFERSVGRGGICDGCLSVRRTYLDEGLRVFEAQFDRAADAGDEELARVFKRARTILKDLERWSALLERKRIDLETLPDMRAEDLTRQLKELQHEEVKLHAARRAAEDAAAAKSRFVAHVSHEIRTPMNAVVAMADLLAETRLDEQQRKYLNAIRRSGDHLVRIVGDILDYSKLEAGRLSVESVPFDLESNLAGAIEILAPRAQEKGIPVIFRYAPGAARWVVGDPARIRQVIMNLVSNAIKFTHTGNVIVFVDQLGLAQDRAVMRITVLDTGIGIPKDKYPAIFEQFEQANAGTYREYGGTGLGLAITNQLVLLMGGQVGLTSREGNGSRFRVTLAMPVAEQSQSIDTGVLTGQRVLVADPNPTSGEFLAALAEHLGARAIAVADRGKIMERLVVAQEEKDPFNAVWLHHMPPYLDAASLGTAIHASELIPRTQLVCFSSAGLPEQRQKFEALGFTAYFHGPCLAADVSRALAEAQQSFIADDDGKMFSLSSQPATAGADDGLRLGEPSLRNYRVLVVDDRPVNQEVATAIFDALGCPLTIATSGEEAVRLCATEAFDIVFMDCQMPVIDGYEATRRIRRLPDGAGEVPIVAMTAEVADGYRERCLQAGMNDYIPKPATRQHIVSAMHRWLNPPTGLVPGALGVSAPSLADDVVLDRSRALNNLGGRGEILSRVTTVFLESVPEEVAALGQAIRSGDTREIERLAHSIKTAAGSLGGIRVSRLAEKLERAGHDGDVAMAAKIHPDFDEEFAGLVRELQRVEWSPEPQT